MRTVPAGILSISALLVFLVIVAGCTDTGRNPAPAPSPIPTDPGIVSPFPASPTPGSPDTASVAAGSNRFGSDLYGLLAADPENNGRDLVLSPYSLSSALSLAAEGAKGKTKDEILAAFHLPANDTARRTGFSGLNAEISSNGSSGSTIRTANALWAEKTYPFLPSYTGVARDYYSAEVANLDFTSNADGSRTTINRWVAERTQNKIPELLPAGSIAPSTRLVITNAVYFNGTWALPFDKNGTQDAEFRAPAGNVTVKMMQATDNNARYDYAETDTLQYIELPYTGGYSGSASMILLLPKGGSLEPAEEALAGNNLSALQQSATWRHVIVYVPKYHIETEYRLPLILSRMGMPAAFTPGTADFSGMDGTRNLFISDIVHKAYIDVNEVGTEAAATTDVVLLESAAWPVKNPPVFKADHPFLFAIQDKNTGAILFMGRVENPKTA